MARLWTAGAELQTATAGIEFSAIITTAPVVETTTKRSGNAAWRISNAAALEGFRQQYTSAQGAFFFRFYLYIVAMPTLTSIIGGVRTTGANKIVFRLTSGGALQFYNFEDSAQIGSNSSALSTATWYRIEMTYDSTTLTATTCEAKIDGTAFASGTIDITPTPTNFGCFLSTGDLTLDYIVDDLAINDSTGSFETGYPGAGEVIVLRPNGNGDNSGWVGSDGNSTDNYLLVDEVPPDAVDYVEENTSGTDAASADDYNLEATPAAMESTDTINVVHVGVYAAVSDVTGADPDIVLRIKASASGTVEESAALDLNSLTYQGPAPLPADSNYKLTLYDLPGASTTAWTKADLDAAQAGMRLSVTDTHFARIAALWVMVDHKPGASTTPVTGVDYGYSFGYGSLKGSGALSGRVAGNAIEKGGLSASGALTGRVFGESVAYGNLKGTANANGRVAGSSIGRGSLLASGALNGRQFGYSYAYGNLATAGAGDVTGRVAGYSFARASLTGAGTIAGRVFGYSSERGNLSATGTLNGRTFGESISRGALLASAALSTRVFGYSFERGSLVGSGVLVGRGYGYAYGRGNLTTPSSGDIFGRANGYSYAYGYLYDATAVELVFSPLDLELCFGNEKDLSAYGGETPAGIPGWVADPSANPTSPIYEPLEIETVGAGKPLSVYGS